MLKYKRNKPVQERNIMGPRSILSIIIIMALMSACDSKNKTTSENELLQPEQQVVQEINKINDIKEEKQADKFVLSFDVIHYVYEEGELVDKCLTDNKGLTVDLDTLKEKKEMILCDSKTVVFKVIFDGTLLELIVHDKNLNLTQQEIIERYHGKLITNVTVSDLGTVRFNFDSNIRGSAHIHLTKVLKSTLDEFTEKYIDLKNEYLELVTQEILEEENVIITDPNTHENANDIRKEIYDTLISIQNI
ncbi:MAG: hypothetical protein H6622_07320 [Halobacteriovoraceae bacterium]|nr:hypothetical protein [Halobacteriovoraceae bacterium]